MDPGLANAAEAGDINALYVLIKKHPSLLEGFDQIPFATTPLHIAAAAGQTLFALEVMRLKPSYGRKLDTDGYSPLHLAITSGRIETAKRLVQVDPELVRVKGREGLTPLLCLSEQPNDQADTVCGALAEFLMACPASIHDLNIRDESSLHIAAKDGRMEALRVLVGWLKWMKKEEMLNGKDVDGNTAAHSAAYTKQRQVMMIVATKVNKRAKNLEGLTPLDLLEKQNSDEPKQKSTEATSLPNVELVDILRSPAKLRERVFYHRLRVHMGTSVEVKNAVLVVATLIMTITYQGMLSPPGGLESSDNNTANWLVNVTNIFGAQNVTNATATVMNLDKNEPPDETPGSVMDIRTFWVFGFFNTVSFMLSAFVIIEITESLMHKMSNLLPVRFLISSYVLALIIIIPETVTYNEFLLIFGVLPFVLQSTSVIPLLPVISAERLIYLREFAAISTKKNIGANM